MGPLPDIGDGVVLVQPVAKPGTQRGFAVGRCRGAFALSWGHFPKSGMTPVRHPQEQVVSAGVHPTADR